MKIHIIITILTFFWFSSFSQKWDHIYGNPNWYESPEDVVESYDQGYLVLGKTGYYDHGWLFKTDINGNVLWEKYFGGIGQDPGFNCLEIDNEGNMYIAGKMKFGDLTPTTIIFKLNPCGDLIWCKTFYMENYEYCIFYDIIYYNDSTILGLAKHNDPEEDKSIYLYNVNSLTGNLNWKNPYAINSQYPLLDVSSGYRLYKFNDLLVISGSCYYAYPYGDTNHFYLRPFFIGIDLLFEENWILPFGVNDSLIGTSWGAIPVSDSIILGFGKRRLGSVSDPLLMFFDYDGNEMGYRTINNEHIGPDILINQICDMQRINDTLLFASLAYSEDEIDMNFCDIHTDTSANVHKVELIDSNAGGGGGSNMHKTFDNKYVITTGYIVNGMGDIYLYKKNSDLEHDTIYPGLYTYDSLCEEPITSGTISLAECDIIVNIDEVPTLEQYRNKDIFIKAFPNPVNGGEITFSFQNTKHHQKMELRCVNVFGELVHKEKVYQHQGETKLNIHKWEKGIYLALVYSENKIVGQIKFIVK